MDLSFRNNLVLKFGLPNTPKLYNNDKEIYWGMSILFKNIPKLIPLILSVYRNRSEDRKDKNKNIEVIYIKSFCKKLNSSK